MPVGPASVGRDTEQMHLRALAIFEDLHGPESINAATVIQNLSVLMFRRGEVRVVELTR